MRVTRDGQRLLLVPTALLLLALAYYWSTPSHDHDRALSADELRPVPEPRSSPARGKNARPRLPKLHQRRPLPTASAKSGTNCEPYVDTGCYASNVHWFDSCGNVLDLDQDCGTGFCRDGTCVDENWVLSCTAPPQGRCNAEVLEVCDAGRNIAVDCKAKGRVCRRGVEGASCVLPGTGTPCDEGPPRCRGNVLERCLGGRLEETDCSVQGGSCFDDPDAGAVCLEEVALPSPEEQVECGPCGCELSGDESSEECNGVDDDGNGYVDDGVACGPIPIDVMLGAGSRGEPVIDEEGLEQEIFRTNEIFSRSGSEIRFELGEIYDLESPDPEAITLEDLKAMARELPRLEHGNEFSVRLIFVGRILEDLAPRTGVALPFVTEGCGEILQEGGIRFDHSLIAVARARTPTTLAHELGHHLGLCHTHEENRPGRRPAVTHEDGQQEPCGEACQYGGDAVCDTPLDSEACRYDPSTCVTGCPGGQQPDTSNVMSYYHACRYQFTADQVDVMEHTLALRRAWFACRNGKCSCDPGARQCPLGMSCRPSRDAESGFACGMDGAKVPGETCRGQPDCGARSMCLTNGRESLCIRPCQENESACTCVPVKQSELRVCEEDFAVAE